MGGGPKNFAENLNIRLPSYALVPWPCTPPAIKGQETHTVVCPKKKSGSSMKYVIVFKMTIFDFFSKPGPMILVKLLHNI